MSFQYPALVTLLCTTVWYVYCVESIMVWEIVTMSECVMMPYSTNLNECSTQSADIHEIFPLYMDHTRTGTRGKVQLHTVSYYNFNIIALLGAIV